MTTKIEPALTAEEWRDARSNEIGTAVFGGSVYVSHMRPGSVVFGGGDQDGLLEVGADEAPFVIALANAALPDSDPRKITRAKLDYIREVARTQSAAMAKIGEDMVAKRMTEFADALESYLPPES